MWDVYGRADFDDAGYRTITFDNRGMPPSEVPPPPYTVAEMADDGIALLEHLGVDRAFVLGASLGANIAQAIALKRPDLVRAVILSVGGGDVSTGGRLNIDLSVEAMRAGGPVRDLAWTAGLLDATLTPSERRDDTAISFVLDLLGGTFLDPPSWDGLLGQMAANAAWAHEDHLAELAGMQVPALLVGHEFDHSFSVSGREAAAEAIPDSELLILPGLPHMPLDPAPILANQPRLLEFLATH